jgi:hypothetical protein
MIEHLKKLAPDIIQQFLASRDPDPLGIPKKLANYILQIDKASHLHKKHHSISECAEKLRQFFPELSIPTCKSRIYDAINYLNQDCTVIDSAWYSHFADMFMKLFEVNIVAHNTKEARICMQQAIHYYTLASSNNIDPERIKFKPQIVSADMELDRMGIKPQGILGAYKKAMNIIVNLDSTDMEKRRIIDEVERELNVTDVDHEEIGC